MDPQVVLKNGYHMVKKVYDYMMLNGYISISLGYHMSIRLSTWISYGKTCL